MSRAASAHPVLFVYVCALLVRVGVAVFASTQWGSSLQSPDTLGYQIMLEQAATGSVHSWDDFTHQLYGSTATFTVPLTLLYRLTGPELWIGQLFVAVAGAGVAALVTRLALEMTTPRWALLPGAIVAFLPSQALFSSVLLKDPFVWLILAALGVVVAVAMRSHGRQLLIMAIAIGMLLLSMAYLRQHTFVVACWAVGISGWFGMKRHRLARGMGAVAIALLIPLLVGLGPAARDFVQGQNVGNLRRLNAVGAASAFIPTVTQEDLEVQAAAMIDEARLLRQQAREIEEAEKPPTGGSGEGGEVAEPAPSEPEPEPAREASRKLRAKADRLEERARSLQGQIPVVPSQPDISSEPTLRYLPEGLTVMLLKPFPLSGGSTSLRLAAAETVLWYPILALAVIGLYAARRHLRATIFPILVGGGVLFVYSVAEGNIGSAFRHRAEFVWVVALLAGLGVMHIFEWRRHQEMPTKSSTDQVPT